MNIDSKTIKQEEPAKCLSCKSFYGSEANKGLCSSCFKYLFYSNSEKLNQRRMWSQSITWEKKVSIPKLTSTLILKKSCKKSLKSNWKSHRKRKKSKRQKKLQSRLIGKDATAAKRKLDCWELSANAVLCTAILTDCRNNIHVYSTTKRLQTTDSNKLWSRFTMVKLQAFDYFFSFILSWLLFNENSFDTFASSGKSWEKMIDF